MSIQVMQALRGKHNENEWVDIVRPYIMKSQNQFSESTARTLVSSSRLNLEDSKILFVLTNLFYDRTGIKPRYCYDNFGFRGTKSLFSSFSSLMVR